MNDARIVGFGAVRGRVVFWVSEERVARRTTEGLLLQDAAPPSL